MKMQIEHAQLKHRLRKIESWLQTLLDILPERFRTFVIDILHDRDPFKQEYRQDRNRERDRDMER